MITAFKWQSSFLLLQFIVVYHFVLLSESQFSKAFSHYVISWYKAFWNTSWETLYEVNWIEFSLQVRGFQHLSLAKSAEFLAPVPGCNGHSVQHRYELVFFLGKMKWQCQNLESKQGTDQYFHLCRGWQMKTFGVFLRFLTYTSRQCHFAASTYSWCWCWMHTWGVCACVSGKERGRGRGK